MCVHGHTKLKASLKIKYYIKEILIQKHNNLLYLRFIEWNTFFQRLKFYILRITSKIIP